MITAKFGDNWKDHAKKHYDIDAIIEIAWEQGRRAIILESRIAELERRLEESCAQNVADNYLVPALSQEVDDLKARNAELIEALEIIDGTICYNCNLYTGTECGMEERHQPCTARETLQSAIRAGKDV